VRLYLLFLILFVALRAEAQEPEVPWVTLDAQGSPQVHLWFFWSRHCPHCLEAKPVVERMAADLPWLVLHALEVTTQPANARRYVEMARMLGREARSVPGFIMCGEMVAGFDDEAGTGAALEQWARNCRMRVEAPGTGEVAGPLVPAAPQRVAGFDLAQLSLPAVTVLLAAMDAFNPCAFFVLLFLLSLLTHQHSRSRMALVGGVFVLCSGLVYFVLMAAWLNLFLLAGELRVVTVFAGLVAVVMALFNLKDYLAFRRGPSLSISDQARPQLFARMRGLLNARGLPTMLLGTVTLALAANSYELLCTAGFPMIYTRILTLQELSRPAHYAYLALYNTIYVMPLLAIVLVYLQTLGSRRLSEAEGRVLKLVSGLMMLGLGSALILAPQYLSRPGVAAALVLGAVLLGALAWRRAGGAGRSA